MKQAAQSRGACRRSVQFVLILIALNACAAADIQNSGIKIIANPGVGASEISREELNHIFLLTKTSLPGTDHVEPVLEKSGMARQVFLREFIGRTDAALMTYYRSLVFTGKGSLPKSFASDLEVTEYVAKTKGAIGYVSAGANTAGVKTLKVK